MNVKEISAKAEDFEFNPSVAIKYYLRTADTLLREVRLPGSGFARRLLTSCKGTHLRAGR
jgi:hypothetical protein